MITGTGGQLFGLVELQVTVVAPCDEALYQSSVLLLIVIVDASNSGGVIRNFLEVVGTRVETEVSGVEHEEEWCQYSSLRCTGVAYHNL